MHNTHVLGIILYFLRFALYDIQPIFGVMCHREVIELGVCRLSKMVFCQGILSWNLQATLPYPLGRES